MEEALGAPMWEAEAGGLVLSLGISEMCHQLTRKEVNTNKLVKKQ